ncbi:hypothetical protein CIPAW_03G031600 [Carya illinoinensis]|uniref:Uncharacterized protein n=1 Tax=Carya illinoinensis TaxID=32201 RepID=A0A8T1QWC3_CARIL|nr:hypothetical protein CIPAW_03G031600 [Carya illinoinensis]
MAPIRAVVGVQLSLPVPNFNRLAFFQDMIQVRPENEIPMSFMESEPVESLLVRNWVERK